MKPTSPVEDAGIPLDDPSAELDAPGAGGPAPGGPAPDQEPPPMDAPMGGEDPSPASGPVGGPPGGEELPPPEDDMGGEESPVGGGAGAITGKYNSSPVGDIKMSKAKGTYNTYKLEMSMGQLEVIRSALEKDHSDPVSDELLATLTYYMDKLPGPGEEEEEAEARNNPQKAALAAAGGAADMTGEETPIPMPPGGGGPTKPDLSKLPTPQTPPGKAKLMGKAPAAAKAQAGLPEPPEGGAPAGGSEGLPPPPAE